MPLLRILIGPTASGKSAAVLHLAKTLGAEILSVDSMKVYRGLDIGTAKPSPETLAAARHHLIDIREPWESYSVADFMRDAEATIADCAARNVPLIGEGGTALYLKTLTEGLFEGPGKDESIRATLEAEADALGLPALVERLKSIDPKAASKILPGDRRRIVRALEVHRLTGKPISEWQSQWGVPRADLDVRMACLMPPRKLLYERIDRRIDAMLAAGWLDECRRLLALPKPLSREAAQAMGYPTLFAHLRGEITLAAARERICFDTHHFARHQLNWYRSFGRSYAGIVPPKIAFIEIDEATPPERMAALALQAWGL